MCSISPHPHPLPRSLRGRQVTPLIPPSPTWGKAIEQSSIQGMGESIQMNSKDIPSLIVLLGPTAAGKTEIAIRLAEHLGGEIVSADSRLFYRGMDAGTAKPTLSERARVPHHLIDVADPDETWSLVLFQQEARRAIHDIHVRGRLPLLVGGTGQYIRAVTEGWQAPAAQPDPRLRGALETWAAQIGQLGLHERLAQLDPQAGEQIDARNLRRTVRALEVILSTGRPFSAQRQRGETPYRLLTLGLTRPRPELYVRIDVRIEAMFAVGWVDEVRGLLAKGYSPALPSFSAIGYPQVIDYLRGKSTYAEAGMLIKRLTRQFVRRQANWFKENDPQIHWFTAGEGTAEAMEGLSRAWWEGG
jgi:tRNA dimethylallyltransferase